MRILIATGIYPPKIGGPAQYAKNLPEVWAKNGHKVVVKTFNIVESLLPTGFRHAWYFFRIIPGIVRADFVLALDTFSVGFPAVLASKIYKKKIIIRTGGDFLWEGYVERTGKKVLFRNFYDTEKNNFNFKERIIFKVTKWTLKNTSRLVFSTEWQRDIFIKAYDLDASKISIVENFYGQKEGDTDQGLSLRTFVASTRNLKWKNLDTLKHVFNNKDSRIPKDVDLLTSPIEFESFIKKIKESYAVVLVSLGDISPNMILDAIRCNKPFICTKETGIYERIKDAGIFVDPLNESEIEEAVLKLLDKNEYEKAKEKVRSFVFTHSWEQIAEEFLKDYNSI